MIKQEDLEFIEPKMSVNYRVEPGFIKPGTTNVKEGMNFPETFFGSEVTQRFPVIKANGKWCAEYKKIHCFVGREITIEDVSENLARYGVDNFEELKRKLSENSSNKLVLISKDAVPKGVVLKKQIILLGDQGVVCSSQKELEKTLKSMADMYSNLSMKLNIEK